MGQLTGIKVLDLTRVLSGPFCTQLLGDLGADVLKIESGDGDQVRGQGVIRDGLSWYFATYNRNKRSMRLNLRKPEAKEILADLVRRSDVVVENFRPGVLAEMGFGWERLVALKPDIVLCSISGFGQNGPYRDRPAFDFVAQAMSGFMSLNGRAEDPPMRSGLPISDLIAGLYGALGVCAALVRRRETGRPEHVDTALVDGLTSFTAYAGAEVLATGRQAPRLGNDHPVVAPYGLFETADGVIAIAPANDEIYRRLQRALELTHLDADPSFATAAARFANRGRINAEVEGRLRQRPRAHWIDVLNRAGVPCAEVKDLVQAFADPQTQAREMTIEVPHPGHGTVRMTGFPLKFREHPCRVARPAPDLGQHGEEVLRELGRDDAAIARLRAAGALD
ncbi:MAG: CoA transferase [Alphaproteobacteria bacterium]|nr:CoA transferase [Alphaproteobacteria bacterium]